MRIVLVSYSFSSGFTEPAAWLERIRGYAIILEALAIQHEVHSIEQIDYEGLYQKDRVNYHFKKSHSPIPVALHRYIVDLRPDLVLVHSFNHPVQLVHLHWMLPHKVTFIVQNHSEKPGRGKRRFLQRAADRFVDAYLISSLDMAREWVDAGIIPSLNKFSEVMGASSPFFPLDRQSSRQQTGARGEKIFLWVGRLDANKDPLTVVRAFLRYARENSGSRLYMIFHSEELLEEIKAVITEAASDEIILVGKVKHREMQYWYNSVQYIIAGSYYEGGGVAVCEAMSCGVTPIVTDIPAFRFTTGNGACGILFEAGNEDSLVQAIQKICGEDVGTERRKALRCFEENLSATAIASAMNTVFHKTQRR